MLEVSVITLIFRPATSQPVDMLDSEPYSQSYQQRPKVNVLPNRSIGDYVELTWPSI